jgi:hypothetical protein
MEKQKEGNVMAVRSPRYSKEEFAKRGDEIYETHVRPQVESENHGKIVAIDIETGAFEVADQILTATGSLFKRLPDAQPWIVRIGYRAVHRFGARSLKKPL